MISLVAFLGNFGKKYEGNRHNVAWHFADSLPALSGLSWQSRFRGAYSSTQVALPVGGFRAVHLLKPHTFINLSGEAIQEAAAFFRIPPAEILVVHDELELPLGTFGLKWSGGLGGHNGLRSAKASCGSADFWRLRFGIGRPEHADVAAYVLSNFAPDERIALSLVFEAASPLFDGILRDGPEPFLAEWAKKKITEGTGR